MAIAARICPNDVRLTLEQAIPGGMSLEEQQWRKLELVTAVARKVWSGDKSKRPRYHRPAKKFQNEPSASTAGQNRPRPIIRLCE